VSEEKSAPIIRKVDDLTYEIELPGEDDTTGNVVSSYLERMDEVQLSYYKRPHPLEDKIVIYVKLRKPVNVKKLIEKVADIILKDLESMEKDYRESLSKMGVSLED
jgi:DNA-directed RNA polymerase subunit L